MTFTDDEKLMLFLIWWHCDCGADCGGGFGANKKTTDKHALKWTESCGGFKKFLSETHEAEECYEFWVSDYGLGSIKKQRASIVHWEKTDFFKNKIKITIEE